MNSNPNFSVFNPLNQQNLTAQPIQNTTQIQQPNQQLVIPQGQAQFQQNQFNPVNQFNFQQQGISTQQNRISFNPQQQPIGSLQIPRFQPINQELTKKDDQIKKLNAEIQNMKTEYDEQQDELVKIRADLISLQTKLKLEKEEGQNRDIKQNKQDEEINHLSEKLKKDNLKYDKIVKEKTVLESELNSKIEDLEQQLKQKEQQIQIIQSGNKDAQQLELQQQIQSLQEKNNVLVKQNDCFKLKLQVINNEEDQEQIRDLQEKLNENELINEKIRKEYQKEIDKNKELIQKLLHLNRQSEQKDQSLDAQLQAYKRANRQISELKEKLKEQEEDQTILNVQLQNSRNENNYLIEQIEKSKDSEGQKLIDEIQRKREEDENERKRVQEERDRIKEQKRKEDELKQIQKAQQEKEKRDYNLQKTAEERKKLGLMMKQKAIECMGQMEVCFVVDITESMEQYKKQTEDCIQSSVGAIKKETGRNPRWSTVAFQDFKELKKLKNKYLQHDFTDNSNLITEFLRKTNCSGGDDYCEDVKGGLKQMIDNLSWQTKFRVAVLICDAPAHGKNVNMGTGDNYPKEDISDVIHKMIDLEIVFIAIQFVKWTEQMIKVIKDIYAERGRQELFMPIDLQYVQIEEVWKSLVDLIQNASAVATGVKNSASKVKGNLKARPKTKDGAMEALCKEKNFRNFDQNEEICVENDFQVFRVDLKESAFEDNIQTIENINENDFYTVDEGSWNCVRTIQPFAFGMMKSVYLMKKKNDPQNHLYVIKMPLEGFYESLDQAKRECRSHLICKKLMSKFMKTLREKHEQKKKPHNQYPEIYYSDFLILQENPRKFWIAERFFDGEFIKYNNNWGFIDDKLIPMNQLAQAFTQYTYQISGYQYMVNDVQGVGVYFTDPAVNTARGDYDDTDMGVDGQSMYMVSFEHKKHISRDILEVMDILIE